jgi:17beta-estradiol 17-dehydrogenase / very-long-chain 3-oxoacyl-CoA reductase
MTPLVGIWRHLLRPRKNLVKRYGSQWAVVTGASDGIGEQYCYELAKSGFNIILVSRTLDKLERVARVLRDQYKVDTRIVQFDFATLNSTEKVAELYSLLDRHSDLDVAVLANNAGKAHMNFIHDHAVDMCFNMVNVNVNAVLFVARYYLARFKDRFDKQGKRSAVINVSSIGGISPSAKTTIYGATKAFDRIFSLGM